jgi:hypothetical protein
MPLLLFSEFEMDGVEFFQGNVNWRGISSSREIGGTLRFNSAFSIKRFLQGIR